MALVAGCPLAPTDDPELRITPELRAFCAADEVSDVDLDLGIVFLIRIMRGIRDDGTTLLEAQVAFLRSCEENVDPDDVQNCASCLLAIIDHVYR